MREIKFRWLYSGVWYYGNYCYTSQFSNRNNHFKHIILSKDNIKEVDEETVWQFTWLQDKNWVDIYEWDIFIWKWKVKLEIYYDERLLWFYCRNWTGRKVIANYWQDNTKIIWNIYQN